MAITELNTPSNASVATAAETSKTKIVFVAALFVTSLAAFICQTELTSQAYLLGFQEPVALLTVTHGLWWLLWPVQVILVSCWRTFTRGRREKSEYTRLEQVPFTDHEPDSAQAAREPPVQVFDTTPAQRNLQVSTFKYLKKSVVKQIHNVYHTLILVYEANVNNDRSTHSLHMLVDQHPHILLLLSILACLHTFIQTPALLYLVKKAAMISVVLNLAGFTWYGAMAMTYASDVTAIYNCSAFTAYAFAIPLLNERFSWLKAASVCVAVGGVFIVAYSGADDSDSEQYPYRLVGNLIISVGAVLYGFYEVLYKRYACVSEHLAKVITPRRQMVFANFVMALMGLFTLFLLGTLMLFIELSGLHHFNLFDYGEQTRKIWFFVAGSIVANLLFSGAFLSLMALTSPVLSSVSSLVTIFLIGIVEWILFGNKLGPQQLLGDALVIIGFVILTAASWSEISQGKDEDEIETASFYSFAASENTILVT